MVVLPLAICTTKPIRGSLSAGNGFTAGFHAQGLDSRASGICRHLLRVAGLWGRRSPAFGWRVSVTNEFRCSFAGLNHKEEAMRAVSAANKARNAMNRCGLMSKRRAVALFKLPLIRGGVIEWRFFLRVQF
jgi:hypothetical protein